MEIQCTETIGYAQCPAVSGDIHQFAESLGLAIDAKDHFTRLHSEEVAVVAQMLALAMGMTPAAADHVHIAGHLHDLGKIGIPDRVLQKAGKLTMREWELIKQHPAMGAAIMAPVHFLSANGITAMVYHHHEAYNGGGYPDNVAGDQIPLGARIIAVADSVSAMMQNRPYRLGMAFADVMQEIVDAAGVRYDPEVVRVLLRNADNVRLTIQCLAEAGEAEDGASAA